MYEYDSYTSMWFAVLRKSSCSVVALIVRCIWMASIMRCVSQQSIKRAGDATFLRDLTQPCLTSLEQSSNECNILLFGIDVYSLREERKRRRRESVWKNRFQYAWHIYVSKLSQSHRYCTPKIYTQYAYTYIYAVFHHFSIEIYRNTMWM